MRDVFTSRRRHTRYWRDWSSDVCSSDLVDRRLAAVEPLEEARAGELDEVAVALVGLGQEREVVALHLLGLGLDVVVDEVDLRSEERRVGKECRSRWSPYH